MSYTVLIVDDSKLARMAAVKAVTGLRADWKIVEAANAEEALAMAREHSVDLAMIDFNMPGVDGLQLAASLRQLRPEMPLALISANIQDEVIAGAREVDAAFLPKPITQEGLTGFISGAALRLKRQPH